MLEARGGITTIGSNLSLVGYDTLKSRDEYTEKLNSPENDVCTNKDTFSNCYGGESNEIQYWNSLLGSHESSKRIIYCSRTCRALSVAIEGQVDADNLPNLVLIRISPSFARSRMQRKIDFTSRFNSQVGFQRRRSVLPAINSSTGSNSTSNDLYVLYSRLMERHCTPLSYSNWLENTRHRNIDKARDDDCNDRAPVLVVDTSADQGGNSGSGGGSGKTDSIAIYIENDEHCEDQSKCYYRHVSALCQSLLNASRKCNLNVSLFAHPDVLREFKNFSFDPGGGTQLKLRLFSTISNSRAIEQIKRETSEYWMFLDTSVLLTPDAIANVLDSASRSASVGLIYSDNDIVDDFNRRKDPAFKPAWNKELLYNTNYIGSFFMLTRSTFEKAGYLRIDLGLSAFYLLLLQASRFLTANQVRRIPKILFHRNYNEYSASTMGIPSYLWTAERDAIALSIFIEEYGNHSAYSERLRDYGLSQPSSTCSPADATVDRVSGSSMFQNSVQVIAGDLPGTHTFKAPAFYADNCDSTDLTIPSVDIVIPTKDKVGLLRTCISSILEKTEYSNYKIVVIDNGSVEPATIRYYDNNISDPRVRLIRSPGEFNYSLLNNSAVRQSDADVLVLLNNDTEVISPEWLSVMTQYAIQPDVGCVGAKLYYSNNRVQHGGVIVGLKGMAGHAHRFAGRYDDGYCGRLKLSQNMTAVTAACLAVRRSVYESVGGLDQINLKVAYNDVDFCLRVLEAGYQNIWTPRAELFHHESVSRGSDDTPEKRARFVKEFQFMSKRWNISCLDDAAYNPNLTKDLEDFSLAA